MCRNMGIHGKKKQDIVSCAFASLVSKAMCRTPGLCELNSVRLRFRYGGLES